MKSAEGLAHCRSETRCPARGSRWFRKSEKGEYICGECHKTYQSYGALHNHYQATHTDNRFQCQQCNQSFNRSDNLVRDMLKSIKCNNQRAEPKSTSPPPSPSNQDILLPLPSLTTPPPPPPMPLSQSATPLPLLLPSPTTPPPMPLSQPATPPPLPLTSPTTPPPMPLSQPATPPPLPLPSPSTSHAATLTLCPSYFWADEDGKLHEVYVAPEDTKRQKKKRRRKQHPEIDLVWANEKEQKNIAHLTKWTVNEVIRKTCVYRKAYWQPTCWYVSRFGGEFILYSLWPFTENDVPVSKSDLSLHDKMDKSLKLYFNGLKYDRWINERYLIHIHVVMIIRIGIYLNNSAFLPDVSLNNCYFILHLVDMIIQSVEQ